MLLSRDTIFELLLKLDLPTLFAFCPSSTQINAICSEPILWQKLLERDFGKLYSGVDAQALYFRYRNIIKFFTPMFPIITDLAIEIIDQYISPAEWNEFAKLYNEAQEYGRGYPKVLDWDEVRRLILLLNVEMDSDYWSDSDTKIVNYVKNYFLKPSATQTVYVRGKPLIVPFNYDYMLLIQRLRYEKTRIAEFYERLIALLA